MQTADPFPLATGLRRKLDGAEQAIRRGDPHPLLDEVSPVTAELLRFWFQADFCDTRQLNFHEGQRRAILAIIYAHEVVAQPTLRKLYEEVAPDALLGTGLAAELAKTHHQHPKYAAKMATGTGKTWVLNALLVWQYLNHVVAPDDRRFTSNFLVVAPGLIVYDRLLDSFLGKERDSERHFETSDIYGTRELFIPDGHRDAVFSFLQSSVVTKADIGRKVTGGGMIAITNWHLLAGVEDEDFTGDIEAPGEDVSAKDAADSLFPVVPGKATGNDLARLDRKFLRGGPLQSLVELPDLLVFNDEAHHIHEVKRGGELTEVEWQRSLTEIASTKGERFVQVDFSATPFNETGSGKKKGRSYFPHIAVDFDLNAAMSAGLVKALALDKRKEIGALTDLEFRAERDERNKVTGLSEGQRVMLRAGLKKLSMLEDSFGNVDPDKHPKLLIVCEDTNVTPFVVEFLKETGLGDDDILRVDSNKKGEVSQAEWGALRERLFDVDRHRQPKVIVSVLMLREGFDVNNICVIVPLRSSQAQILLEQTVGRGLRLMWRGDEQIDEAKAETRQRISERLEPQNFFDVLFIVEHPAFSQFYEDLLNGGLAGEVGDEADDTSVTGDIELVELRNGYEQFDFWVPFIVREAEEELEHPSIDPLTLQPTTLDLDWALKQLGTGDRFVSQDAQTGTQYGDYSVESGVMTATGYNDYLARITKRIADALHHPLTSSAKKHSENTRFPLLQVQLAQITAWCDTYIRERLFDQPFDPLQDEQWRVLLLDEITGHIAGRFATALIDNANNHPVGHTSVVYRLPSEVRSIPVRSSSCVEVTKCIYPRLPVPKVGGGLERKFMEWAEHDTQVEALLKIHEHKHSFLQHRYLKADGMPAMYSPDFLVRVAEEIYVVETKSQHDLVNENVERKRRAAVAWCDRINELAPEKRSERTWHYVIVGETAVDEWRAKNARVSELLDYARLRRIATPGQSRMF